jgi:hypothetical protein
MTRHSPDDGHEHVWPGDIEADSCCEVCGLQYDQWSED